MWLKNYEPWFRLDKKISIFNVHVVKNLVQNTDQWLKSGKGTSIFSVHVVKLILVPPHAPWEYIQVIRVGKTIKGGEKGYLYLKIAR